MNNESINLYIEQEQEDIRNVIDESEQESSSPTIYNISSYGADLSTEQHAKRMRNNSYLKPDFQRSYVWNTKKASRFIESLLLGLPVPSIFLYREPDNGKIIIIDGLQRLTSVAAFYEGNLNDKKFRLTEVNSRWENKSYSDLDDADKLVLDDSIIHTIYFKQDSPSNDKSSIYHVFERINTGGMNLTPQEIRVCVSHGEFADLLKDLNNDQFWRKIYGKKSIRMKDQELILRFLALHENYDKYEKPMKDFLNNFMSKKSNLDQKTLLHFTSLFKDTVKIAYDALGASAFRPERSLNAAVLDSCMVGIANMVSLQKNLNPTQIKSQYENLLNNEDYKKTYNQSTADTLVVKNRMHLAIEAFNK